MPLYEYYKYLVDSIYERASAIRSAVYYSIASFGLAAFITVTLLFTLSRILPNTEYISFSIILATTQLLAVLLFEWIRVSSARFEPGLGDEDRVDYRDSVIALFLLCSLAGLLVIAPISYLRGTELSVSGLIVVGAIIQGIGDLVLTALRSRERLIEFSVIQVSRAIMSAGGAAITVLLSPSAEAVFLGFLIGAIAPIAWALRLRIPTIIRSLVRFKFEQAAQVATFGVPAAMSSMVFMTIPVGLRWLVAAIAPGPSGVAAILSIDVIQKPFFVAIGAVQGVLYPGVVSAFEAGNRQLFLRRIRNLFRANEAIILTLIIIGYWALPIAARTLLHPQIADDFSMEARLALLLFGCQSYIQNNALIPSYVERKTTTMLLGSLFEIFILITIFTVYYININYFNVIKIAAITVCIITGVLIIYVQQSPGRLARKLNTQATFTARTLSGD